MCSFSKIHVSKGKIAKTIAKHRRKSRPPQQCVFWPRCLFLCWWLLYLITPVWSLPRIVKKVSSSWRNFSSSAFRPIYLSTWSRQRLGNTPNNLNRRQKIENKTKCPKCIFILKIFASVHFHFEMLFPCRKSYVAFLNYIVQKRECCSEETYPGIFLFEKIVTPSPLWKLLSNRIANGLLQTKVNIMVLCCTGTCWHCLGMWSCEESKDCNAYNMKNK